MKKRFGIRTRGRREKERYQDEVLDFDEDFDDDFDDYEEDDEDMLEAGEDPRFIFRRMTIFCSEDIGMADPKALPFVIAAAEAFDRVGLPEGHYPLAHAALYCATAPKSNSVMGFFDALKVVGSEREDEVPNHLCDASRDKEGFGHGVAHDAQREVVTFLVARLPVQ